VQIASAVSNSRSSSLRRPNEVRRPWMRPTGWFIAGWSYEVGAGSVVTVPFFGDEIVMYRDGGGVVHALDAHCRHLGAHLGSGRVEGDCVVCPFHGWRWGPDGTNRRIPTADRPSRRRLRVWPLRELNGLIYVWHDSAGRPPSWELPDLFDFYGSAEAAFLSPHPQAGYRYERLTIQPRIFAENIVDPVHFQQLHRTRELPTIVDHQVTPHSFQTRILTPSRGKKSVTPGRDDVVTLTMFGVGVGYTRFEGRDDTHSIVGITPIDEDYATLYQTIWLERIDGEHSEAAQARLDAVASVFPEDITIWKSQIFLDKPGLVTAEAALFRQMREWARSFEPRSPAARARANTTSTARGQDRTAHTDDIRISASAKKDRS
jgi:3-ketosteroid 9alpha-monooxygenase subunit A